jgi:uncharacterized protein
MIIDSHVHILPPTLRDRRDEVARGDAWFAACHEGERVIAGIDELLSALDEAEIDVAVCLGWPFAAAHLREETNEYLATVQHLHPKRIVGFGIVDPAAQDAPTALQRCVDRGLAGIGELNCDAQGFNLDDERVDEAAAQSAALGLRWTLHCSEPLGHQYAGKGGTTPERVARFALRHPELQLVCAHLGGGLPLYSHMPEVHALCRRLWFDTAAAPFLYAPTVYRAVINACGAERMLFGSDFPLLRAGRYRAELAAGGLDDAEQRWVMGGGAAALLGLSG